MGNAASVVKAVASSQFEETSVAEVDLDLAVDDMQPLVLLVLEVLAVVPPVQQLL